MHVNYCDSLTVTISSNTYYENGVLSCQVEDAKNDTVAYKIIVSPTETPVTNIFFCIRSFEVASYRQDDVDVVWATVHMVQAQNFEEVEIVRAIGEVIRHVADEDGIHILPNDIDKISFHFCAHAVGKYINDYNEARQQVAHRTADAIREIDRIFSMKE